MPDGYDIAKKAPAKKNTRKWCHGKVGVDHVLEIRKTRYFQSLGDKARCRWHKSFLGWNKGGWSAEHPRYHCFHEEYCVNCGKILRNRLANEECPEYHDFVPGSLD